MGRPSFNSAFAAGINAYLDHQVASGWKEISFITHLRLFDRFCVEQCLDVPVFTKENAEVWSAKRDMEATTTHYARVNGSKRFLSFLSKNGYDVFVMRDVKFKETEFKPHIYTDDEVRRYFVAVDAFSSSRNRKDSIQYPVLFRLLYCCGARINETLGIRKRDVDLASGIIRLLETKNNRGRIIVLGSDTELLMEHFADKCFYMLADDDYIFTNANGGRLSGDTVYGAHRSFLQCAGIPFLGNGNGPRIHDWRHTMAVRAFKGMIDAGMDMYVALPILSAYLGHKTIYATERYVRLTMSIYPHIEARFGATIEGVFKGVGHYEED
jgi:integrase